jgi:hypothetical protein
MNRRDVTLDQSDFPVCETRAIRGSSVPPATGRDDVLWKLPAELLGDFEAACLGAFGV